MGVVGAMGHDSFYGTVFVACSDEPGGNTGGVVGVRDGDRGEGKVSS